MRTGIKSMFLLLIAFLALAAGLLHHPLTSAADRDPGFGQSQQVEDEGSTAHIARIENDLPPAVVIKGQAAPGMKLSERMQFYKVPGVSVAFFGPRTGDLEARIPIGERWNQDTLRPAGMTHSTYEQPLPKKLWPLAATPYDENGEPVKGGWHTYPEMAPAGLWATPSDVARLAIEVQNEYAGRSNKILSQSMARKMLARQTDDWGLGFALSPGHQARFAHAGQNAGY